MLNVEKKSCSIYISKQLCQKIKYSYSLSFQDKDGINLGQNEKFFAFFGPLEALEGSENLKNGSGTIDYPYFDPSNTFLVLQGAKW